MGRERLINTYRRKAAAQARALSESTLCAESHPAWESLLVQGSLAPEGWMVRGVSLAQQPGSLILPAQLLGTRADKAPPHQLLRYF